MSTCDITTCKDGVTGVSFYQSVRLQNYTGRKVEVRLASLKKDSNGKPYINKYGVYEVALLADEVMSVDPSKGSGGGEYTIISGFTDPYDGFVAYTDDQQFGGIVSAIGYPMDSGCCQDYWMSIGLKSGSKLILVNSEGTTMDKTNAFYLRPVTKGLKNAYKSMLPGFVHNHIWLIIIVLIILVAIVVAVVYKKYY